MRKRWGTKKIERCTYAEHDEMWADSRLGCFAMKTHSCARVNERDCPSRSIESRELVDITDTESLPRERGRLVSSSRKNKSYREEPVSASIAAGDGPRADSTNHAIFIRDIRRGNQKTRRHWHMGVDVGSGDLEVIGAQERRDVVASQQLHSVSTGDLQLKLSYIPVSIRLVQLSPTRNEAHSSFLMNGPMGQVYTAAYIVLCFRAERRCVSLLISGFVLVLSNTSLTPRLYLSRRVWWGGG